ncbi:MAG TPA: hypothetical protein VMH02_12725 [Verrucomicrobiae bacterium]|nr:hypothetical protein [Verrucomicrobiae bacterium]
MKELDEATIDRLLARYGLRPLEAQGTDTLAAAAGGTVATIRIARRDDADILQFETGAAESSAPLPLTEERALELAQSVRTHGRDARFSHMVAHLLLGACRMYADTQASLLVFEDVHLHPWAYHIGRVALTTAHAPELVARLAPDSHDRGAVFAHRHGESTAFPK